MKSGKNRLGEGCVKIKGKAFWGSVMKKRFSQINANPNLTLFQAMDMNGDGEVSVLQSF